MQVNIASEQNTADNLRLLVAQRHLYTRAKGLRRWRTFGSVGLAGVAPFILFFWPNLKSLMAFIGGFWTLIASLVGHAESKKKKEAATIQEQFDTELFELPWNHMLVGNKLTPELIHAATRDFKGSKNELRDWYSDPGSTPYPLNVLLCQRSNLVWDWRLRRHYGTAITVLTAVYFIFTIVFVIATKQTLLDYILGLFLPSLSAFLQGIEVAKAHFTTAKEQEDKEKESSSLWESGLENPDSVSQEDCRKIQDWIYLRRSTGPLVPDWWYKWLRDKYDIDMRLVVEELKAKVGQALKQ